MPDRIMQQAIFQIILSIFEKQFNDNSFEFGSRDQEIIRTLE